MTKIMTFTIFVLTAFHVNAQESISTLGQDLIISSGSLSFTLGQISNETQNLSSYSLQEGVQQVYSDNSTFGIVKSDSEYAFEIYPNPFQNHIIIQAFGKPSLFTMPQPKEFYLDEHPSNLGDGEK